MAGTAIARRDLPIGPETGEAVRVIVVMAARNSDVVCAGNCGTGAANRSVSGILPGPGEPNLWRRLLTRALSFQVIGICS